MLRRLIILTVIAFVVGLLGCSRNPETAKKKYLQSGQRYMEKGKYQQAQIQFRTALELDPRFVEAYYQLAKANLALSQWSEAFAALKQTLALDSSRADAHLNIGQLHLAAREFDKAVEEAEAVIEADPKNPAAYQLLGAAYAAQQQSEKALRAFKTMVEIIPTSAAAYVNLALVEITMQHFSEAEGHLNKAAEVDPTFVLAYSNLASLYRLQNQVSAAEQLLQRGIERVPDAHELYLQQAEVEYGRGNKAAAATVLERLTNRDPKSVSSTLAVGEFYVRHGETDIGLREYQRSLSLNPKNDNLRNRIVDLYLDTGRTPEARSLNDEVLRRNPKDPIARIQHSRILIVAGQIDQALTELQRQVADTPDSATAHYFLGVAHWQSGRIAQANASFQDALRIDGNLYGAWRSLATLHFATQNLDLAEQYARHMVEAYPGDAMSHLLLGDILLKSKKTGLAREQYKHAQALERVNPAPHLGLAAVAMSEKKNTEAEREFELALRLNPQLTPALGQLADFYVATGQRAKALKRAQDYVSANTGDATAHYILGSLFLRGKQYKDARQELDRSIQLSPNLIPAYLALGKLHEEQNEADAAIAQYEVSLSLQPRVAPLITMVGNLYLDKGDVVKARQYYERALQVEPNFAPAAANLAWVYTKQRDNMEVALSLAQKAKQLQPDSASITDTLGWVHYHRGSYALAIPLLRECVQVSPEHAIYRYHLGMALLAADDKQKSKAELLAALRYKLPAEEEQKARQALSSLN